MAKFKNKMLPRPYVGSFSCEKGHQFFHKPWILALAKSVETFIMVSISDMPPLKYWQSLGSIIDKAKENIPKNTELVIHVSRNWKLLEVIYTQDMPI